MMRMRFVRAELKREVNSYNSDKESLEGFKSRIGDLFDDHMHSKNTLMS